MTYDHTDWLAYYTERAAIREYDGHQRRAQAEANAIADCEAEYMRQVQGIAAEIARIMVANMELGK